MSENKKFSLGGFPPIYILKSKEKDIEHTKDRQIIPSRFSISIKDILNSKKK
jgi:hypothetical protein